MHKDKRKKLESKGWRVGSVTDFLGLSPDEELSMELKLRLAGGLKQRRVHRLLF